ncbi:MAG: lysostaphin resistance A-like protein [Leptolyngbyaceae cyanobacterium]
MSKVKVFTQSQPTPFHLPQIRWLVLVMALLSIGSGVAVGILDGVSVLPIPVEDPVWIPVFYLIMFGGCVAWYVKRYQPRGFQVRSLMGPSPSPWPWKAMVGIWFTMFLFSLGAFQVSYGALSWVAPDLVESTLNQSLFLGGEGTAFPLLYNVLMVILLVVAAPTLEEFIFRGVLLHRWATRWGLPSAVVGTSLIFGIFHANWVGLSMFGLVMALLYLRSRSLGLVMGVHALNNGIAAGLEVAYSWVPDQGPVSLADFQSGWWIGLLMMGVSAPFLWLFIRRNWQFTQQPLPYSVNVQVSRQEE